MARTREFDTDAVVRAARDVFWEHGYDMASLADLERATGLGRSSLYQAFGSKRGLFDAAVEEYLGSIVRPRLAPLLHPTPGRNGVRDYLDGFSSTLGTLASDSPHLGCLLVSAAPGIGARDDAAGAVIRGYRSELEAALAHALEAAGDPDPLPRAKLITGLLVSALLIARIDRSEALALLDLARTHAESTR